MINPFAKRIEDKQLEMALVKEAQGEGIVATLTAALNEVAKTAKQRRYLPRMARCGGALRPFSIKQRTRLNQLRKQGRI